MPRNIKDKDMFEEHYKTVLEHSMSNSEVTGANAFEQSDIEAIN